MKFSHITTLAFSALACAGLAQAQQAGGPELIVHVQFDKAQEILKVTSCTGDTFQFTDRRDGSQKAATPKDTKIFYIDTPKDLVEAEEAFRGNELAAARKQLAAVKSKYAMYNALPGNPSTKAALMELECAVRMQDWAAVRMLANSFPKFDLLKGEELALVEAARIAGMITDDPGCAGTIGKAYKFLSEKKKDAFRNMPTDKYAWVCYARGRSLANGLGDSVPADKVDTMHEAVDLLCQCVMASRGKNPELVEDALSRSIDLLVAAPGVREAMGKLRGNITKKTWEEAPFDLRDAVAMAKIYRTVVAPKGKNKNADALCKLFYNATPDRNKGNKAEGENKPKK